MRSRSRSDAQDGGDDRRERGLASPSSSLLVAALTLAACRAPVTTTAPEAMPASSSEPASPPEPGAIAAPQASELVLTPIAVPLPDDDVATQGQEVSGLATPWARATADALGVNLAVVATAMDLGEPTAGTLPVILTSYEHGGGRWTYVRSATVRIHQLLPVRLGDGSREIIAVLTAPGPPDEQIIDGFDARWTVGLLDREGTLLALQSLETAIPRIEGLWDVISTSLHVDDGNLRVIVEYAHSGGGDPCSQSFSFHLRVDSVPRPVVIQREHQQGVCAQL